MTTPEAFDEYAMGQVLAPRPCDCPPVTLQRATPAGAGMVSVEGSEVAAPPGASGSGWILTVGTQRVWIGGA